MGVDEIIKELSEVELSDIDDNSLLGIGDFLDPVSRANFAATCKRHADAFSTGPAVKALIPMWQYLHVKYTSFLCFSITFANFFPFARAGMK